MTRRFLQILCLLVTAGCVTTANPWDQSVHSQQAVAAPNVLVQDTERRMVGGASAASAGSVKVAGLEVESFEPPPPSEPVQAEPLPSIPGQASGQMSGEISGQELAVPTDGGDGQETQEAQNAQETFSDTPQSVPVISDGSGFGALPPVKVGLLVPLSGKNKDLGQAMLQAAQMALFDMGFEAFELLPRDTADGAALAAQSAVDSGAQLLLGPVFAADVRDAQSVAHRYDINMIAFTTDWNMADGNTYIMGFLPFAQVTRIVEYAQEKGYQNLGILAPDSEYGNAVVATYNSYAYRAGAGIRAEVMQFSQEQGDVGAIVQKFSHYPDSKQKPPPSYKPPYDAVLLPISGEKARSIVSMLSYYNMGPKSVRRLSTGLWDDAGFASDPSFDGAWFAAPSPDLRAGFERRYSEAYGKKPPRLSSLAYDATALAAALARSGYETQGTPAFDRSALTNPNGFAGIDGIFRFRSDGLVERGMAVLSFKDGKIVEIDPAPSTFQNFSGQ